MFKQLEEAYGVEIVPKLYGNGHINKTYVSKQTPRLIIQEINTNVFKDPKAMMQNIIAVTEHIRRKLQTIGKNTERAALTVVPTKSGEKLLTIGEHYFRAYLFIEDSAAYDLVTPDTLRKAGSAFGEFQKQLADFPAETLTEVIPNFHNTPSRFNDLCRAAEEDKAKRAKDDAAEIAFFRSHERFYHTVTQRLKDGRIPLAVTHNDTKINNILFDAQSGEVLAVIDLDTVMPGSRLYDFGDALRTGGSTAKEDEENLSLVGFDEDKFRAFTEGYLNVMKDTLSPDEIALLPESALLLTLECGMRFLTDDLDGDVYFRVHKDRHNLIRARNQIKQAVEIEKLLPRLHAIVERYTKA